MNPIETLATTMTAASLAAWHRNGVRKYTEPADASHQPESATSESPKADRGEAVFQSETEIAISRLKVTAHRLPVNDNLQGGPQSCTGNLF
jgi:hypothetical protein